jgi:hypothetical protein
MSPGLLKIFNTFLIQYKQEAVVNFLRKSWQKRKPKKRVLWPRSRGCEKLSTFTRILQFLNRKGRGRPRQRSTVFLIFLCILTLSISAIQLSDLFLRGQDSVDYIMGGGVKLGKG